MIDADVLYIENSGGASSSLSLSPTHKLVKMGNNELVRIAESVTNIDVSYSVDGADQVKVKVADYRMDMWKNNYFQLNTRFKFKNDWYLLSAVELGDETGEYVTIDLTLRQEAVQKMRLDKQPQSYKSATGFEFAQKVAKKFGLQPVIETATGVKQATIKVKVKNNKESVWDVLQRSAKDIQFLCFVSGNQLFYCSPHFLLGAWGLEETPGVTFKTFNGKKEIRPLKFIPLKYPNDDKLSILLAKMPSLKRSEDSPKESEGNVGILPGDHWEKGQGIAFDIRAGMTIMIYGIYGFNQAYIITGVEYTFATPDPIKVTFATLDKLSPADQKQIDAKVSETIVISGTGKTSK